MLFNQDDHIHGYVFEGSAKGDRKSALNRLAAERPSLPEERAQAGNGTKFPKMDRQMDMFGLVWTYFVQHVLF